MVPQAQKLLLNLHHIDNLVVCKQVFEITLEILYQSPLFDVLVVWIYLL